MGNPAGTLVPLQLGISFASGAGNAIQLKCTI